VAGFDEDRPEPAEVDDLPDDCEAEPGSESSAVATAGVAATAKPSPNAKAAEPTRTPNAAESMTTPVVIGLLCQWG